MSFSLAKAKKTHFGMEGRNSVTGSWRLDCYHYFPHIFISFLGVILNLLLLYAILKDPLNCFKKSGTFMVINLAVSDLIMCLVIPGFLCVKITAWLKTTGFIIFTALSVSILTISSISIDRFVLVAYPMKHSYTMKGKVLIIWPSCIWFVGIIFPTKLVVFGQHSYDLIAMNCFCAVMVVFSAFMYALTYFKLKKQSRNMQALQSSIESRAQEIRVLKEKQFLRTIVFIASIAVICIVPHVVLFSFLDQYIHENLMVDIVVTCMATINFSVNPLIYIVRLPNYRKTFCLLYCKRR